ncbi:MAG: asparagine synthase (glutamine-hydrolyzing) [Thermaerobacterales bacterium]
MCGIAGWIDWQADLTHSRPVVAGMARTLTSRGPDAGGVWVSKNAALAHRRLIVIDPEGGAQPMVRQRGGKPVVLNYNGELYNTGDLRHQLEQLGHRFEGHSDTEVLLAAFLEWDHDAVERLNGIFAFALWDEGRKQLILVRDRLGVKPLFYARRGSSLIFASELKGLLAHPLVEPVIDSGGLAEIFAIGPARTPGHGVFRGIEELKPGCMMVVDTDGARTRTYWSLESRPHTDDQETTSETVRELLRDTVERQLVSDVPICTLLSGGLDSSALTAFAALAYRRSDSGPIHTFSIDYADNDRYFRPSDFQPNADAPWVGKVADRYGTVHHPIVIDTPELVDALTDAMRARDLPGMADIDASLLLFCREIKKQATVALSGECADEVFGGYPWFHRQESLAAATFPWSLRLAERTRIFSGALTEAIHPESYVDERYRQALAEAPLLAGESPAAARIREIFHLSLFRWMPTLLDRKDRMSMAAGLEVRVPFCDHRLVEYAWNIPWDMKMTGDMEKGILRHALTGLLPDDVLKRRKSPFPKTHNPAYLTAVKDWVQEILADPNAPIRPLVDSGQVRQVAEEAAHTRRPWFGQLMAGPQMLAYLGQINTWLREYRIRLA